MRNGRSCGKCTFYTPELTNRASAPGIGACHARPPQVQLQPMQLEGGRMALTAQGFWPPVRGEKDWCGAFVADEATK